MKLLLKNTIWSLTLCLNLLKMFGFLVPGKYSERKKTFLKVYGLFWYFYTDGVYIIVQAGDLLQIWGNLTLMVGTSFLLFTNVAFGMKIINVMMRHGAVQDIIDNGEREFAAQETEEQIRIVKRCDRETSRHLYLYIFLSALTVLGWAASAEKSALPLRAWYPYDTSKSPFYEITYFHQVSALFMGATLNVSLDTLVTSLVAICRYRLQLLNLSLNSLCDGLLVERNKELRGEDAVALRRLTACVCRHQAVLNSAGEIQRCFTEPILAQFAVSMVIICVTAYQLAVRCAMQLSYEDVKTKLGNYVTVSTNAMMYRLELHTSHINVVRVVGMTAYLLCMILQVFLYCYQGHQLLIESSEIASAAYSCPWYLCSVSFRRALLVVMVRAKRDTRLTAGGFTTLSLTCFTAIVKASYTFFTVLQRVEDRQK